MQKVQPQNRSQVTFSSLEDVITEENPLSIQSLPHFRGL